MAIADKVGPETSVGPTPWGTMFASLAVLADGNALVAFRGGGDITSPGNLPGIFAREFGPSGEPSGPQQVLVRSTIHSFDNPSTGYDDVALAALPGGGYGVAWSAQPLHPSPDPDRFEGKLVASSGAETPFSLPIVPPRTPNDLAAAALADGRLVVLSEQFESRDVVGGVSFFHSLDARIVGAAGTPVGAPIRINPEESLSATDPVIAALDTGGFVAVWHQSVRAGATLDDILTAQVFDTAGARVGAEIALDPAFLSLDAGPAVAALPGGRFVVAWKDYGDPSAFDDDAIIGRIYEADGTVVGLPISVETTSFGGNPVVASVGPAGFVIAWDQFSFDAGPDRDGASVAAQMFDPGGLKIGGEFLVNTTTKDYQHEPLIAGDASGRFVVAWTNEAVTPSAPSIDLQAFQAAHLVAGTPGGDAALLGTVGSDLMRGFGGDDGLFAGAGGDVFIGDAGNDTLDGGDGVDAVEYRSALAGHPVYLDLGAGLGFDGLGGQDSLLSLEEARGGGAGDVMVGSAAGNALEGETGNDTLFGGDWTEAQASGGDALSGGRGDDLLFGLDGGDRLDGGQGADTIVGGSADDDALAGADADLLFGGAFAPGGSFRPGSGNDTLDGGTHDDVLWGFDGNDSLQGGAESDILLGGDGDDVLRGGNDPERDGNGSLFGEAGNDTLAGAGGFDYLTGGAGADTFVFGLGNGGSWDRVTDFAAVEGDRLRLDPSLQIAGFAAFQSQLSADTLDGQPATILTIERQFAFSRILEKHTVIGISPSEWTPAMVEFG